MLEQGQVVRYQGALWRVHYVNACRAHIVPLAKRHVELPNGATFDTELRGVNISNDSCLDVVADPERAAQELELLKAELELRAAKAALAKAEAAPAMKAPQTAARPTTAAKQAEAPPTGWHWHRVPDVEPDTIDGSLKQAVLDYVRVVPGATTRQVAAAHAEHSGGAVAACLDRFFKAGILRRS